MRRIGCLGGQYNEFNRCGCKTDSQRKARTGSRPGAVRHMQLLRTFELLQLCRTDSYLSGAGRQGSSCRHQPRCGIHNCSDSRQVRQRFYSRPETRRIMLWTELLPRMTIDQEGGFPKAAGNLLRACDEISDALWRERRAGRCKAPRRRRCGDIVEERQRSRCPPAAAPLRAAARRPAGCVARSLHTAAGMRVARA